MRRCPPPAAAQNRLYSNTEPRQCRSPWQKTLDNVHRNGVIILTALFVVLWPSTMLKKKPADPKRESLHRHGSLNRRPQDVTDELFIGSDFFDPRDLVQVKYEMLRRVQEDGHASRPARPGCRGVGDLKAERRVREALHAAIFPRGDAVRHLDLDSAAPRGAGSM